MLFGVVDNFSVCVEHLNKGANLVGALWYWHFKGNYWWSDSRYIRTLCDPQLLSANRVFAEQWCSICFRLRNMPMPRIKNLFYLEGLATDEHFIHVVNAAKAPELDGKVILSDKRLESSHCFTIQEFLKLRFKCAVDRINILPEDYLLIPELMGFLNYDGAIQVIESGAKCDYLNGYKSIYEYFPPEKMTINF